VCADDRRRQSRRFQALEEVSHVCPLYEKFNVSSAHFEKGPRRSDEFFHAISDRIEPVAPRIPPHLMNSAFKRTTGQFENVAMVTRSEGAKEAPAQMRSGADASSPKRLAPAHQLAQQPLRQGTLRTDARVTDRINQRLELDIIVRGSSGDPDAIRSTRTG
jgi:hypothetical protein